MPCLSESWTESDERACDITRFPYACAVVTAALLQRFGICAQGWPPGFGATSTLFVVLTPDGLRAQDTFASSTIMQ